MARLNLRPLGIPAGGLFSGAEEIKTPEQAAIYGGVAGEAYDRCYHQACYHDQQRELHGLDQLADGAAHAVAAHAVAVYAYARARGKAVKGGARKIHAFQR